RGGVRGVPPRGPVGLAGLGPGARDDQGPPPAPGRAHLQQRPGAHRRPQAPVPPPVHRLPQRGRGAGDPPAQGARDLRAARPAGGQRRPEDPRPRAPQGALGLGEPGLGAGPRDPQRRPARLRPRGVDAHPGGQARARPRARQGEPRQGAGGHVDGRPPRRARARRAGHGRAVDERILEFIGDLRRADVRVGTTEALDALQAAAAIGLDDREDFRHALAATLVKETRDLATFDRLFDLYFFDLKGLGAEAARALGREDPWARALLEQLLAEAGLDLDPLTDMLLLADPASLELAVRRGGRNVGLERLFYFLQVGYFTRRIWDQFPWQEIEGDLDALLRAAEAQGLDPGALARLRTYMELRLEAFRRMVRQHVERELARRGPGSTERLQRELLADKPLFTLSADEVAQMRAVVARLARRIKDALALRRRREQEGKLDTHRTLRASLPYGGVPVDLRWRRRHREKPRLVTLCDVSDSVRNASRFMLQLVWNLQE